MKVVLIEDEINVREVFKKMILILAPTIEIIGESGKVDDAIELINLTKPDLIFMDIELENGTGFDVLKKINIDKVKIIFTTAYNQYAIKAFKYSAIDYLLKPIDPLELESAINRVASVLSTEKEHLDLLKVLQANIASKESKIVLKTSNQRYIIKTLDIIRLEADGAYTLFVTKEQKIVVSKNLKYYQELLDESIFVRCHQSHLINVKNIKGLDKNGNLIMSNQDVVIVSMRKKNKIKQIFR